MRIVSALLIAVTAFHFQLWAEKPASLLLINGQVITDNSAKATARGLRIEDGRIIELHTKPVKARKGEVVVDLKGGIVLPGLIDAHFHLESLGQAKRQLDLRGLKSKQAVLAAVKTKMESMSSVDCLVASGWDENIWTDKSVPIAQDLDKLSSTRCIWLERVDGHVVWVNSVAMKSAGINEKTMAPPGGDIKHDSSGKANGIFIDNAINLIKGALPEISDEEFEKDLIAGMEASVAVGLSAVHDMSMSPRMYRLLKKLEKNNQVQLRITGYLHGNEAEVIHLLDEKHESDGLVKIAGVKFFADGSLGSHAAALLAPYSDKKSSRGLELMAPDEMAQFAKKVQSRGYQVAIHAIGDRANRSALDLCAELRTLNPSAVHRIEHVQVVAEQDWKRFAHIGVIASMQPTHCTSDMPWVEKRLGSQRLSRAYPWQSLLKNGAQLAFGSDAPVENENPWYGIYAALSRQDHHGNPGKNGFTPKERISVQQTIAAFTRGAALAERSDEFGIIAIGSPANLTVIDKNPYLSSWKDLLHIKNLATIVNGKLVWQSPN